MTTEQIFYLWNKKKIGWRKHGLFLGYCVLSQRLDRKLFPIAVSAENIQVSFMHILHSGGRSGLFISSWYVIKKFTTTIKIEPTRPWPSIFYWKCRSSAAFYIDLTTSLLMPKSPRINGWTIEETRFVVKWHSYWTESITSVLIKCNRDRLSTMFHMEYGRYQNNRFLEAKLTLLSHHITTNVNNKIFAKLWWEYDAQQQAATRWHT